MNSTSQSELIQILHLEDEACDSEIVQEMLLAEGIACRLHRVDTAQDFEAALEQDCWSLILSDYSLPNYDCAKALELARSKAPHVPFIVFSGTIGEETAIQSLRRGASDYVLKHRPARLAASVRHALDESKERDRQRQMELELEKSAEREKQMQAQFLRMQRMESIGSMVGGIAHDLNNTLAPILMGIGFMRSDEMDPRSAQMLATMEGSAKRAADMLRHVLAFAKGVEGETCNLQVDSLLHEMERIVKNIFPKSIEWRVACPPDLWCVRGHATQLHQVLMNLCINARDAMPLGGRLTLTAENVSLDGQAQLHPEARPGAYVLITATDTGEGMKPEVLEQIFQPFFTTKNPGQGTGLGLSTSLNIVKAHGGFVTVKSQHGQGTEFGVYLPAFKPASTADAPQLPVHYPAGRGEWILVVDDESAICEIAKATLENYSYRVLTATSGPEAIAIFADRRQDVKLVITDAEMPLMDGRATCHALRGINPALRIVAASCENAASNGSAAFAAKTDAVIQKPYTAEKLLSTVHEVLSDSSRG